MRCDVLGVGRCECPLIGNPYDEVIHHRNFREVGDASGNQARCITPISLSGLLASLFSRTLNPAATCALPLREMNSSNDGTCLAPMPNGIGGKAVMPKIPSKTIHEWPHSVAGRSRKKARLQVHQATCAPISVRFRGRYLRTTDGRQA